MRKNSFNVYKNVFDVFEDMFNGLDIFNNVSFEAPRQIRELSASQFPPTNLLVDKSRNYVIEVALAGVTKEEIRLDLEGRHLKLFVKKGGFEEREGTEADGRYCLQRGIRDFTEFSTTYLIPRQYSLLNEDIKADVKDGLLTITIAPTAETKLLDEKRQITIG
jgi:HSP20 family molecular chaperone IbpA